MLKNPKIEVLHENIREKVVKLCFRYQIGGHFEKRPLAAIRC